MPVTVSKPARNENEDLEDMHSDASSSGDAKYQAALAQKWTIFGRRNSIEAEDDTKAKGGHRRSKTVSMPFQFKFLNSPEKAGSNFKMPGMDQMNELLSKEFDEAPAVAQF